MMHMAPEVQAEWHEQHRLCAASCTWLREHGEPGDPHPIATGIETLRRNEARESADVLSDASGSPLPRAGRPVLLS